MAGNEPKPDERKVIEGELLLEVRGLTTRVSSRRGTARAVNGVDLRVHAGETVAIVGESGSGKSLTCLSILGLPPKPGGEITDGEVLFLGEDLLTMDETRLRTIRGKSISMILQDPGTALNPALTVGYQIEETLKTHLALTRRERRQRAIKLLSQVDISDPHRRIGAYPHELSGGMKQRVAGALAIACSPKIVIADEPTTALDTTIQAQYLRLLVELQARHHFGMILVTHDLGVVAKLADRVLVMYGGRVLEEGGVRDVLLESRHPYTAGLVDCLPRPPFDQRILKSIPGEPPDSTELPPGCPFAPRCSLVLSECREKVPQAMRVSSSHLSACIRWRDLSGLDSPATG